MGFWLKQRESERKWGGKKSKDNDTRERGTRFDTNKWQAMVREDD